MSETTYGHAAILAELAPMFEKAKTDGLWFWSHYQDLWFTPSELAELQACGRFVWGPSNWELHSPAEALAKAERVAAEAAARVETIKDRIGKERV